MSEIEAHSDDPTGRCAVVLAHANDTGFIDQIESDDLSHSELTILRQRMRSHMWSPRRLFKLAKERNWPPLIFVRGRPPLIPPPCVQQFEPTPLNGADPTLHALADLLLEQADAALHKVLRHKQKWSEFAKVSLISTLVFLLQAVIIAIAAIARATDQSTRATDRSAKHFDQSVEATNRSAEATDQSVGATDWSARATNRSASAVNGALGAKHLSTTTAHPSLGTMRSCLAERQRPMVALKRSVGLETAIGGSADSARGSGDAVSFELLAVSRTALAGTETVGKTEAPLLLSVPEDIATRAWRMAPG